MITLVLINYLMLLEEGEMSRLTAGPHLGLTWTGVWVGTQCRSATAQSPPQDGSTHSWAIIASVLYCPSLLV